MTALLKQSTAVDVIAGPFKDDSDFKTAETGLSIAQADIRLSKNGAAFAQSNNSAGATHRENGSYLIPLDATDTNTLGRLRLEIHKSGALSVWRDFMVIPANVFDSLVSGSDNLEIDLAQILGTSPTEGASGRLAGAFTKWFNVATPTGTVNSIPDAVAGDTGGLSIVGSAMTLASSAVQAIWDAATSALTTAGSIGKLIVDNLNATISSRAPASTALSNATWTDARAPYLDNLNVGGPVASSAEATAIQNNTRVVRVVPDVIERPDSGTATYRVEILLYDDAGNMEAPDSAPTIALVNQAGTDRSSRLDSATMTLVSTGRYRAIYTADAADTLEQLVWTFSVVEGGNTRLYGNASLIVDTTAVDFTSSDRTDLQAALAVLQSGTYGNSALKTILDLIVADTGELQADWANGGRLDLLIDAIKAKTDLLPASPAATGDIPSAAANATAVLAAAVEGAETLAECLRLIRAMLVGKSNGFPSGPHNFRDKADAKNRVVMTSDADGNRLTVTTDAS